jgi:cysteine desulfurase
LEHHATLDRLKYLRSRGWDVLYLENNRDGVLNLEQLKTILKDDTKSLVSLLYANNETGVIHPIKEISDLVHQSGHLLHIDAVQALGKIKFSIEDLDLDFASFSGHKIGAFKGIGCLYVKDIKKHMALLHGGGQERGFRPGTLNYPAIKSFSLALDDYMRTDLNELLQVRKALEIDLKNLGFKINCEDSNRLPNTISIMIPGMSAKEILAKLAREEIFVSTGSACSSGSFEPSHVLKGLGFTREEANSCLRISIGPEKFQIKIFLNNLREIVSI